MILALALAASEPATEAEITVIGRKLSNWRGNWTTKRGQAQCRTRVSSGDRDIDAIGCAAMLVCVPKYRDQFRALADAKLPKAAFQAQAEPINKLLTSCVETERDAGIEALADRRAGATQ